MRPLLVLVLLLASSIAGFAEESIADYKKRIQAHVDGLRYVPAVGQAAHRSDAREVMVHFTVFADGNIGDVRVSRSSVSRELNGVIARCFGGLSPVRSVPKKFAPQRFAVVLSLGGTPNQK
jgi:outer membrane biosynthesis protein TonB